MKDRRKRVAIFFYEGYLGVAPTVVNLAKAMAGAGHQVTIYTRPSDYPDAGDLGPGITVVNIWSAVAALRLARRHVPGSHRMAASVADFAFEVETAMREVVAKVRHGDAAIAIAVDMHGAFAALVLQKFLGTAYALLSLELRIPDNRRLGLRGRLARLAYRGSTCVIVQGNDRKQVLDSTFKWSHTSAFILPNSPFQKAATTLDENPNDVNYLRSRLSIPKGKRIALHAGMIDDLVFSKELARSFSGFRDWALVYHERRERTLDEPYLRELREMNRTNLYLSLSPVPYDRVGAIYNSADVGLAFYRPSDANDVNFSLISSSGKLPHYLLFGKPVLVGRLAAFEEIIATFDCGIVVSDPADTNEVGNALERVRSRYDHYSRNALRCFAERFDFGKQVAPLTRLIAQL